jgi:hypothetical protein
MIMTEPLKSKKPKSDNGRGTGGIITLFHWDGTFIVSYRYKSLQDRKDKLHYWHNIYGLNFLKHFFIISPKIIIHETTKNKSVSD